jgi:hypothetical protein
VRIHYDLRFDVRSSCEPLIHAGTTGWDGETGLRGSEAGWEEADCGCAMDDGCGRRRTRAAVDMRGTLGRSRSPAAARAGRKRDSLAGRGIGGGRHASRWIGTFFLRYWIGTLHGVHTRHKFTGASSCRVFFCGTDFHLPPTLVCKFQFSPLLLFKLQKLLLY